MTGMTIEELKTVFAELDFKRCFAYLEYGEGGTEHKKAGIVLDQTPYKDTEEEVDKPVFVWIGAYTANFTTKEAFAVTVEQADTMCVLLWLRKTVLLSM